MPKIRMKTLAKGPNIHMEPGKVYDVSKQQADDLVAGRYAEYVGDPVSSIASDGPARRTPRLVVNPPDGETATADATGDETRGGGGDGGEETEGE